MDTTSAPHLECRIGNVEGPFRPTTEYSDGTKIPGWELATRDRRPYYVVRGMINTSLQDRHFHSLEMAQSYWDALPDCH